MASDYEVTHPKKKKVIQSESFKITRAGSRGYFRTVLRIGKSEFILMSDGTAFGVRSQQLELRKALKKLIIEEVKTGYEGARSAEEGY